MRKQKSAAATSVRVRDGRTLVTDGPFAETTEQLGGYSVLDLTDLDEAIAVAARLPPAAKGTVEIRPLVELEGLPPPRPLPPATGAGSRTPFLLLCYIVAYLDRVNVGVASLTMNHDLGISPSRYGGGSEAGSPG